ncbi:MAG: T9SS C-terminal target domain-containing protein [Bacteroidetes bacterium]|nr:MAG: T9SS C-terminal target domain-containing protein [Bacteroidota bacterium]
MKPIFSIYLSLCLAAFYLCFSNTCLGQQNPLNIIVAKTPEIMTNVASTYSSDHHFIAMSLHPQGDSNQLNIFKLNANADTIWHQIISKSEANYYANCLKATSDGHLLVAGDCENRRLIGSRSFLAKLDTLGNLIWIKHFGQGLGFYVSSINDLIELPDGNYVLAGYERQSSSVLALYQPTIYKVDTSGNVIWRYYKENQSALINKITYHSTDTSFYCACTNILAGNKACMIKFNSKGVTSWIKYYDSEHGNNILKDSSGLYFLTNRKLYKTNFNGDSIWVKSYDVTNEIHYVNFNERFIGYFNRLARTKDGGFLLGGSAQVPYYAGNKPSPLSKSYNFKLIKTDANGNQVWNRNYGNGIKDDYLSAIEVLNDSVIALTGLTRPNDYGVWLLHVKLNGSYFSCPKYLNQDDYLSTKQCKGDTFFLRLNYDSGYSFAHSWRKDSITLLNTTRINNTTLPGNYWLYLTDSVTGCKDSVQQVAFNTPPPAGFTAGNDVVRCIKQSQTIQLQPVPKTGQFLGTTVSNNSNNTFTVKPSLLGAGVFPFVYRVLHESCDFRDTLIVTIDSMMPPKATITSNRTQPMCKGDTVTLRIDSNYYNCVWSGKPIDKGVQNFSRYKDSSLAYVSYSYANYVCSDTVSFNISFKPTIAPPTLANAAARICKGDSVKINTTQNYDYYLWSTGDTTPYIYMNSNETYSVQVNNNGACISNPAFGYVVVFLPSDQPDIRLIAPDTIMSSLKAETYTWFRNDVLLPDTGRKLVLDGSGKYELQIKQYGIPCISNKSVPFFWTATGLSPLNTEQIILYPNPASSTLTIQGLAHTNQLVAVTIYNLVGQPVIEQNKWFDNKFEIPLHNLSKGVYCMVLTVNNQVFTKNFYKE